MKKEGLAFAVFILAVSLASAFGITIPHPQNIELTPGQSSYFTFQIQTDDFPVVCVPEVQENDGLELAFNPQYEIEAGQRYNIKPQIIVPKQTPFGSFEAKFCMKCSPSGESAGGSRIISSPCGLPVTVNVVSERTRENMFDTQTERVFIWLILLIIVLIILILSIIIYLIVRRRRAKDLV